MNRVRPVRALMAILAVCILIQPVKAQQIKPDGFTSTTVKQLSGSNTFEVQTKTTKGVNAFNSFSNFNLNTGYVANLIVPNSTTNLINIVKNSVSNINGVVNTIKNGHVGGNLYFVNPNGIILGPQGTINTGSLFLITPTKAFVNTFFDSPGNPNVNATKQVLGGYPPVNPDAVITINGKTNSITDTLINTGTLNLNGDVYTGAVFNERNVQFGNVVNIHTIGSPTNIAKSRGAINIEVAKDFNSHGKLVAEGGDYINAAPINIYSGDNINIFSNSYISSNGRGVVSNGDNIIIYAGKGFYGYEGSTIINGAGEIGDGGYKFILQNNKTFYDYGFGIGGVVKHGIRHGTYIGELNHYYEEKLVEANQYSRNNNIQPRKPIGYDFINNTVSGNPRLITINNMSSVINTNNQNNGNIYRQNLVGENEIRVGYPAASSMSPMKYRSNRIME